jgi:hypothetical protein
MLGESRVKEKKMMEKLSGIEFGNIIMFAKDLGSIPLYGLDTYPSKACD